MNDKADNLEETLRALEQLFVNRLPARIREMEDALAAILAEPGNAEHAIVLHRLLHTMAGSAGTFGFPEVGLQAREFEKRLKIPLAGDPWPKAQLDGFVADIHKYFSEVKKCTVAQDISSRTHRSHDKHGEGIHPHLIYLVMEDQMLAEDIKAQLSFFGYEVMQLKRPEFLTNAIAERRPDVLVAELSFPDGQLVGAEEIDRIKQTVMPTLPVIFISGTGGFDNRLYAVRVGGGGYFIKPVDMVALTERIDALTWREDSKEYRVLIVDDDAVTAQFHVAVLTSVGMKVRLLNDPCQILNVMTDFRPEIVLMDVYMPVCSGIELSKIIRQDNSFLDVPIVFLSSEDDITKQLDAVQSGADDFLTKPITQDYLISAITTRAERYRSLRSLIMRDGLTGLYNHTAIKEKLGVEISTASRNHEPLSLAVLDLDFFKSVNDNYGHPVGDQVLRSLSHMLQQRLRRSDIVGRYGGEEFIVIFPRTSAAIAGRVLDELRLAFQHIRQQSVQGEFSVTFSAGLADLSASTEADGLFDAADSALYKAKLNGRNCIQFA